VALRPTDIVRPGPTAVEAAFTAASAVLPARPPDRAQAWVEVAAHWTAATETGFARAAGAAAEALSAGRPARSKLEVDDFATTLLAVLVHPPWYSYITVGDCYVVVGRRPGGPHLVVPPATRGPRGLTTFLTSSDVGWRMSFGVIDEPQLSGLALCSDGLIEATLDTARLADGTLGYVCPAEFARFFEVFADAKRPAAELAATLTSPDYAAASGDDMTMVLAVRR